MPMSPSTDPRPHGVHEGQSICGSGAVSAIQIERKPWVIDAANQISGLVGDTDLSRQIGSHRLLTSLRAENAVPVERHRSSSSQLSSCEPWIRSSVQVRKNQREMHLQQFVMLQSVQLANVTNREPGKWVFKMSVSTSVRDCQARLKLNTKWKLKKQLCIRN